MKKTSYRGRNWDRSIEYRRGGDRERSIEYRRGGDRERSVEDRRGSRNWDRSIEYRRGGDWERSVEDRRGSRNWDRSIEYRRGGDRERSVEDRRDRGGDRNSRDRDQKNINSLEQALEQSFWQYNNSPEMKFEMLPSSSEDITGLEVPLKDTNIHSNLRWQDSSFKTEHPPAHSVTMGLKIESVNEGTKETLVTRKFKNLFVSNAPDSKMQETILKDKKVSVYSRKIADSEARNTLPRPHSEIAALQKLTNLDDPVTMLNNISNGKGSETELNNFKKSALYEAIENAQKARTDDGKLRVKMYMQLSHWYPCNDEYDRKERDRGRSIPGDDGRLQCDTYLKNSVYSLNNALKHIFKDVEVRLKAANYGDKKESQYRGGGGEESSLWAAPMVRRYSGEDDMTKNGILYSTKTDNSKWLDHIKKIQHKR